jgi:hypothetical protein
MCLAQADPWERINMIKQARKVDGKLHTSQSLKGKMDAWRNDGLGLGQGRIKIVSIEKPDVAEVALLIAMSRGRKAMLAGTISRRRQQKIDRRWLFGVRPPAVT